MAREGAHCGDVRNCVNTLPRAARSSIFGVRLHLAVGAEIGQGNVVGKQDDDVRRSGVRARGEQGPGRATIEQDSCAVSLQRTGGMRPSGGSHRWSIPPAVSVRRAARQHLVTFRFQLSRTTGKADVVGGEVHILEAGARLGDSGGRSCRRKGRSRP